MAKKWTPERNERLLLLVISEIKVDAAKLAKSWSEQYGSDDFKPTPRAISEQFGVLKKKAGYKGKVTNVTNVTTTPKTPRTTTKSATTPKKSTKSPATASPSKRKKASMSDDEESGLDDNDDSEIDIKNLPKGISRASLARDKKKIKSYEDPDSDSEVEKADDESDDVPIKQMPIKQELKANGAGAAAARARDTPMADVEEIYVAAPTAKINGISAGLDSIMGELMAGGVPAGKQTKLMKKLAGAEDDSDVSDFAASFASARGV